MMRGIPWLQRMVFHYSIEPYPSISREQKNFTRIIKARSVNPGAFRGWKIIVRQAARGCQLKRSSKQLARDQVPDRRGVAFRSSDLSDVGANRPFAGMAFDEMRRPRTQRTFNTLGLKTSLGRSARTGSRSRPRISAQLATIPFLGPRTEPF
jgi:hypothetical protein